MPTNLDRAALIAQQVQLHSISLHSAHVQADVDPLGVTDDLVLRQGYRGRYEHFEAHPDHLYVYIDLHFEAIGGRNAEPAEEAVALDATYLLVYELTEAQQQPADALQHFAELNGTYNAWPYWRELVQTVTGRVGLGAIVVPVFRPQMLTAEPEEQEELFEV